ncbi:hypothetical protein [Methylobacterium oryzihabitans]|uniref:B30.2/SPRY domain-containing protein n=1 Tax=Methylobacterium oryzihabitans TaxID=2499852 RepID=A0A437NT58_9HYPH|nr:hypothetical protein [Methylobacterium oryzihabitans]RVU13200.1 hypothetical protein EOE48_26895 [Methylobacterium oryzihabitans]
MRNGSLSIVPGPGPRALDAQQVTSRLVPPFYAAPVRRAGAWNDDPTLRRYGHPPLVNPIEPGVAADPERPGTGVDTLALRPGTFEKRSDPAIYDTHNQDVLVTGASGIPATGHTAGWVFYGRNIVLIGLERTATNTKAAPKISYHLAPWGSLHVEGIVIDHALGGADDAHYVNRGPYLWNQPVFADASGYPPGAYIITPPPSLRLYRLTTPGTYSAAEPTHETAGEVMYGTAGLTFITKYADLDAYRAAWPRATDTFQNCYSRGRHGSYWGYDGGPLTGDGQTYVLTSTPITKITRDAAGLVTLTAPGHGMTAGTHTRINVAGAPYEVLASGRVGRGVGGVRVPTIVDANTITYQTDLLNRPIPPTSDPTSKLFEPPAAEPFVLQGFTKAASCSVTVAGGVATITTDAPHGSVGTAGGLVYVRLFGRSLPQGWAGKNMTVATPAAADATSTTITAAASGLVDGTYADLVVTLHHTKVFTGRWKFSPHADYNNPDVMSRNGYVRYYRCTDTHHSYDHTIAGLRFPVETGLAGIDYDRVNIRRRKEIIPHDDSNYTIYANESDQSTGGVRMAAVAYVDQGPRGLTRVNFGRDVTIELDRDEDGTAVVHPPAGGTCNGVRSGSLDRVDEVGRYLSWPANALIAGRIYLAPCQTGDTRTRDILQRGDVGLGYVKGPLADAKPVVAPPAPTVEMPAATFSENTLKGAFLGWVRCPHGQEDQIADVTLDESRGGSLGGRFRIRGGRLVRGLKAMDYAGAVDIGGGQRGYLVPLIAKMRSDRTKATIGQARVPITAEATPFPISAETLNPASAAAGLVLSDGNLTATVPSDQAAGSRSVKATRAIGAGRRVYFEVATIGTTAGANGRGGFGLAPAALGSGVSLTQAGGGAVSLTHNGALQVNGAAGTSTGIAFVAVGSVVRVCVDAVAGKVHLSLNGGAWANGGDPAAGTGGYDVAGLGDLLPAIGTRGPGDAWGVTFDGGAMSYPIPSGFTAL